MRPYQLWRHRVGTDPAADAWSTRSPTTTSTSGVGRTKDDRLRAVGLDSKVTSEVRVLRRRRPRRRVHRRRATPPGHRVLRRPRPRRPRSGRAGRFLIVTNDGAEDFRLMEAPDDAPGRDALDARSSRPAPGSGSTASTPSPATWWSTSARTARPGSGSSSTPPATSTPVDQPESPSTVWGGANPEYDSTVAALRVHLARHPPLGLRPRPRHGRARSCASASRSSVTSTRAATAPSASGPRPTTAPGCPISLVYRTDLVGRARRRVGRGTLPALRLRLLRGRRSTRPSPRSA